MKQKTKYYIGGGVAAIILIFLFGKSRSSKSTANVDTDWLDPSTDFKVLAQNAYNAFNGLGDSLGVKKAIILKLDGLNNEELKQVHNHYLKTGKRKNSLYIDFTGEIWVWSWNESYKSLKRRLELLQLI